MSNILKSGRTTPWCHALALIRQRIFVRQRGRNAADGRAILLALLFAASGTTALIYELVWVQLLSLFVGSDFVSIALILAIFMGGMCAGALLLPGQLAIRFGPLRGYACLELLMAAWGLAMPAVIPRLGGLYASSVASGPVGFASCCLLIAGVLAPPTMAMGATLPLVARWVELGSPRRAGVSLLYGANLFGAVAGCVLAGFVLLRFYDGRVASFAAAAINSVIALVVLGWVRRRGGASLVRPPELEFSEESSLAGPAVRTWPILFTLGLSGATALGSEIVWTRMLALSFGATVYTFSLVLAAILIGLGLGSATGTRLVRLVRRPSAWLASSQFLLAVALAWAAWLMSGPLPFMRNPFASASHPFAGMLFDFLRCLGLTLPGALLWGASFPLALGAIPSRVRRDATGSLYAANTLGGIVGALGVGLLVIPAAGTLGAQRVLVGVSMLAALLPMSVPAPLSRHLARQRSSKRMLIPVLGVAICIAIISAMQPLPLAVVGYGRHAADWRNNTPEFVYFDEGLNGTIAISQDHGVLHYHNAGKVQASTGPQDMRLQRMLGHLTTLLARDPRNVLVIGCGAAVTAGAVSIDPRVLHTTIVEIEPRVPPAAGRFFGAQNHYVLARSTVRVEIADARSFLLGSDQSYDAITSDPFDAWVKGSAALATREFFEEMKRHLNPGGVVTLWVPLYETSADAVKTQIATFLDVFPHALLFGNTQNGRGYEFVLVGAVEAFRIDVGRLEEGVLDSGVRMSLAEIGLGSVTELLAQFAAAGDQLQPWLVGAQLNRDRDLRLQYLAGLARDRQDQSRIFRDVLRRGHLPEDLFVGDPICVDHVAAENERLRRELLSAR